MNTEPKNIIFIGAGILTATLCVFIKELFPNSKIIVLERLSKYSQENSNVLNNAGTGYSGFCELNSTKELADGSIDINSAIATAKKFELSKEFWSYWVDKKYISNPKFIHSMPQMSFVWGNKNVEALRKRKEALENHPLFKKMEFSIDFEEIREWAPLMIKGRNRHMKIGATRMILGTDVNYGTLTKDILNNLQYNMDIDMKLSHNVLNIKRISDLWEIKVRDEKYNILKTITADFLFIGAGGGTLPLLQKSGIEEAKYLGGFPVSGKFLVCNNPQVVENHNAKVFGKVNPRTPPMSVPHLDKRSIDDKPVLLFGPFAGTSTKFLLQGSKMDLINSFNSKNIFPFFKAAIKNRSLINYLLKEVIRPIDKKIALLKEYYPEARKEDWEETTAGQRVQIIDKKGYIHYGTRIVTSEDKSLVGLFGDSPGASSAVANALEVLNTCFPQFISTKKWREKINKILPSYYSNLDTEEDCYKSRKRTHQILNLTPI